MGTEGVAEAWFVTVASYMVAVVVDAAAAAFSILSGMVRMSVARIELKLLSH